MCGRDPDGVRSGRYVFWHRAGFVYVSAEGVLLDATRPGAHGNARRRDDLRARPLLRGREQVRVPARDVRGNDGTVDRGVLWVLCDRVYLSKRVYQHSWKCKVFECIHESQTRPNPVSLNLLLRAIFCPTRAGSVWSQTRLLHSLHTLSHRATSSSLAPLAGCDL